MKLVIAEKPSVAQTIAKVLGVTGRKQGYLESGKYVVSWCYGHLIGLAEPESYGAEYKGWNKLPILPQKWNYKILEASKEQFYVLKSLMERTDIESIVCATDAGREGELIFRHVYNMAGCQKQIERLWVSSLEDSAIKQGFNNLAEGKKYDALYNSALCRERADWIVGMNMTRFFSTLYNSTQVLSVGRVQTPTLCMIVNRDNAISSFKKEKYYTVIINCGDFRAASEKISYKGKADETAKKCNGSTAEVKEVTKEEKRQSPPKLYDLTTLQRDANRKFGFTANQTLEAAQRLYESKLITYPRTDSCFLTDDMSETALNMINIVRSKFNVEVEFQPDTAILLNSKKVSDHHAIIPTANFENLDLNTLTDTDRKIIILIAERLLSAASEKYVYESTKIQVLCCETMFSTTCKKIVNAGYKGIESIFNNVLTQNNNEETEENLVPSIAKGDTFDNIKAEISEGFTQPPKAFTEDTLLAAMEKAGSGDYESDDVERKGLGTPATRASIIETLVKRGYVERKKKQLASTEKGRNIIAAVPDSLKSPKLTADWENRLTLIAKGESSSDCFIEDIKNLVKNIIASTTAVEEMKPVFNDREVIGKCPRCGSNIYEGKINYYCENKDCSFALWKDNKYFSTVGINFSKDDFKELLAKGKVLKNNLKSKRTGKVYSAYILIDDNPGNKYIGFKMEFPSKNKKKSATSF